MQYFFTKNHSNTQKNIKQYDVFLVVSPESLTKDHLIKFSRVLDAKYIEKLFKVNVIKVNIINQKTKLKIRQGKKSYKRGYKKAVVTLKKGQSIDLTTGI